MFLIETFNLVAVFVFAISASLSAIKRKFDLFGISFVAFVTSVGGGTVRDILLGDFPVSWMKNGNFAYSIICGILISFIFTNKLNGFKKTFFWFDTIGIGVSTIIGTYKAIEYGLNFPLCVLFGVMSSIFGGIIRDTLCNDVPLVFRKEIYATACIMGSVCFQFLNFLHIEIVISMPIAIVITIMIRFISIKYNLKLPNLNYKLKGKINV